MNAFLSLIVMLTLIAGLRGHAAMAKDDGLRELDRNALVLGKTNLFAFDYELEKADFIGIVRLIDRGRGEHAPPPFPAVRYSEAKVEVLHMLLGEGAGVLKVAYGVRGGGTESFAHPPLGTVMIAVALKSGDGIQMIRYLFPTTENLAMVGRLIREYHARELQENPAAAAKLDKALYMPLDAYQPQVPPPSPSMPPAVAQVRPSSQGWLVWLGVVLVVALLAAKAKSKGKAKKPSR